MAPPANSPKSKVERRRAATVYSSRPLKLSEQAVFRWVVIVGLAAVSVIGLTLLTTRLAGALWGLLLVVAAGVHGYRWLKSRR